MTTSIKAMIAGAAIAMTPMLASATTVSGIIEEGGPSNDYNGLDADYTFGDFNNGTSNPLLTVVGDFQLYGSVTHVSPSKHKDGWTMDFGTDFYDLTFDWQNTLSSALDFDFTVTSVGGTTSGGPVSGGIPTLSGNSGSLVSGISLTGKWTFAVDPIAGNNPAVETMNWQLYGTKVAPVPLPASSLLLLAGIGGLAAMRRKGRSA